MLIFRFFYSSKNPEKMYSTVLNIDNNNNNNQNCFLSSKSAYYNDFWRSCDTEDWSNDAENTDLNTEINYILTDIHIESSYFK